MSDLTPEAREELAREHQPDSHGPDRCGDRDCFTSCAWCGEDWPCETAILLRMVTRLEAQTDIRGRAVVMYRERAREAERAVTAWEQQYTYDTDRLWQELDDTDARIKAVRELHTPEPGLGTEYCCDCEQMMPCETLRALDAP